MPSSLQDKLAGFLGPARPVLTVEAAGPFKEAYIALEAALADAHGPTVWLLAGTFPSDLRPVNGPVQDGGCKAILAAHDFHPEISYATVLENGRAITVLWPAAPHPDRRTAFGSLAEIDALGPFSLPRWAHLLLPVSEGALSHLLGYSLNPDLKPPLGDGNWRNLFSVPQEGGGVDPALRRHIQNEVLKAMENYKRELEALKEELALLRGGLKGAGS